ncbi:hypothetical protein B0T19DRAFT_138630 [Cercophora scortea]|uniref:Uncharacterized protein n=1 Tax=Cercophora scortea TaxID=314031 RepID=A0AAE0MIV7_9PEZI|nr:hypothetical protein B0T19DRAFT_138630 [Cercophora scortea]
MCALARPPAKLRKQGKLPDCQLSKRFRGGPHWIDWAWRGTTLRRDEMTARALCKAHTTHPNLEVTHSLTPFLNQIRSSADIDISPASLHFTLRTQQSKHPKPMRRPGDQRARGRKKEGFQGGRAGQGAGHLGHFRFEMRLDRGHFPHSNPLWDRRDSSTTCLLLGSVSLLLPQATLPTWKSHQAGCDTRHPVQSEFPLLLLPSRLPSPTYLSCVGQVKLGRVVYVVGSIK